MRDIPIIFSEPMVLALLYGLKTQTRRLALRIKTDPHGVIPAVIADQSSDYVGSVETIRPSPWQKVKAGDRLWVRENLSLHARHDDGWRYSARGDSVSLAHDDPRRSTMIAWAHHKEQDYCPSIHMPRWASRITLAVTATKIERLHDITPDDAWCEGVNRRSPKVRQMWLFGLESAEREQTFKRACIWEFEDLWKKLHPDKIRVKLEDGSSVVIDNPARWDANPSIVALTFSVHQTNVDKMEAA